MTAARIGAFALLVLLLMPVAAAKDQPDYTAPCFVLEDVWPERLLERVNKAAAHGYRLLAVAPFATAVLMEKTSAPPDAARYRSLSWPNAKETLEERLNAVGASGYRLVPGTMSWAERDPQGQKWEYRVLSNPTDPAVYEVLQQGYEITDVLSLGTAVMFFFERPSSGPTPRPQALSQNQYLALDAIKQNALQEKLSDAALRGYRVRWVAWGYSGAATMGPRMVFGLRMVVGLERSTSAAPPEYLVLAKKSPKRLEGELNAAGARGFRLFPKALFQSLLILEKPPSETRRYEYRLVLNKDLCAHVRPAPAGPPESFQAVSLLGDLEMDLPVPVWPAPSTVEPLSSFKVTLRQRATNLRIVMERPLP